jgi:hypothetical protein
MSKGERVFIGDPAHPWYGSSGEVTGETIQATKQYVVDLDNGMSTAVYERQVKVL